MEGSMRILPVLLAVVPLFACAPAEETPPPPDPVFEAFAGSWDGLGTLEGVDDPTPFVLAGGADGSGWTMTLRGREPIPVQVSLAGDSLIAQSDSYESVLRMGVTVSIRMAAVFEGETLIGKLFAAYQSSAGEEDVLGTLVATRTAP
jgi:hypothetical protein